MFDLIRRELTSAQADAWVIYDFGSNNPAFVKVAGRCFTTRKCFAVIDRFGAKKIICHSIDLFSVQHSEAMVDFEIIPYSTWQHLEQVLGNVLGSYSRVMMEISENGMLPRSSFADYGTVCLIKRFVRDVIPSADLFQSLTAAFDGEELEYHIKAAQAVDAIKDEAFAYISRKIADCGECSEYEVQQFILRRFGEHNMISDESPIVAVGSNANNPHYEPTADKHSMIRRGDLVLIDLWAKHDLPQGVYADITWMGFVGEQVPRDVQKAFDTVKGAIDRTLEFLEQTLPQRPVCGYEVDEVCSGYLKEQGYGQYILHRTGHSISPGDRDHGMGVNIDNFETHDTRHIIDKVAFSVEPGIYTPDFGVREEINVYIKDRRPYVYTPRQKEIVLL